MSLKRPKIVTFKSGNSITEAPDNQYTNRLNNTIDMLDILDEALEVVEKGGVILYPTDTIWGLGCDPFDEQAVKKIFTLKNRDAEKAFILLVNSVDMLKTYLERLHPRIETLLAYHERPLSIIYDNPINLPESIIAKDGTIGIRVTKDPFCCHLIDKLGKPLVSTSANISGQPFPANFNAISSEIIEGVDYVVGIRQNEEKEIQPSVVASINKNGELEFLRG